MYMKQLRFPDSNRVHATLRLNRKRLRHRFVSGPWSLGVFEFITFGIKQAWACLFGGLLLALILMTYLFYPDGALISRYDFLVIMAVLIQVGLLITGLETWEEAKVILVFHIVGTIMEISKRMSVAEYIPKRACCVWAVCPCFLVLCMPLLEVISPDPGA